MCRLGVELCLVWEKVFVVYASAPMMKTCAWSLRSTENFFVASLFHTLLFRGNRQQWFRHSEYTVKSGDGNQASSTICVAIRTTESNFCLVYFLICFCPHPVGYAMFRTRLWILHNAFARSARIRPCMWRRQWRDVHTVRLGFLLFESQSTHWFLGCKGKMQIIP